MPAPAVAEATLDLYGRLPEHFRTADVATGYQLLRYLDLLGFQAQEVRDVLELLGAGQAGMPLTAPGAWLDWMAQFVNLDTTAMPEAEKRIAIDAASSLIAGSEESMRLTIEALLGGEKRYMIERHADGEPFKIRIYVNVDDAGGTTWDTLAVDYPSWNAWEAVTSWDDLATVAPINERAALLAVKPAWIVLEIEAIGSGSMWLFFEQTYETWDEFEAAFATWDDFEAEVFGWL